MVPLGNSPTLTGLYVYLELTWLFKIGKIHPNCARAESFAMQNFMAHAVCWMLWLLLSVSKAVKLACPWQKQKCLCRGKKCSLTDTIDRTVKRPVECELQQIKENVSVKDCLLEMDSGDITWRAAHSRRDIKYFWGKLIIREEHNSFLKCLSAVGDIVV